MIGSLCTGYGGLDLAVLEVLGGRLGWCADPDRHIQVILRTRLPHVANLGDISRVDWAAVPAVDVITAGFPCQDLSVAGNGAGITKGTRSGLWFDVMAAVRALRPALVVVENVEALRWRRPGLDRVLGDLAEAGYDACWRSVCASDIGAPHRRERIFLLAHPAQPQPGWTAGTAVAHPTGGGRPPGMATELPARPRPPDSARRRGHHLHLVTNPATAAAAGELTTPATARPAPDRAAPPGGWRDQRVAWGEYTLAIRRWEALLARPAPPPAEPTRTGRLGVGARFVEWMMGLPAGWVTDIPIPRSAQLRALGNGVVPAQAAHALRQLLTDTARHDGGDTACLAAWPGCGLADAPPDIQPDHPRRAA